MTESKPSCRSVIAVGFLLQLSTLQTFMQGKTSHWPSRTTPFMTHNSLGRPEPVRAVTPPAVQNQVSWMWTVWAVWRARVAGGRETAKRGHSLSLWNGEHVKPHQSVLERGDNQPHAKISPASRICWIISDICSAAISVTCDHRLNYATLTTERGSGAALEIMTASILTFKQLWLLKENKALVAQNSESRLFQ